MSGRQTLTTSLPCPEWCTLPDGHAFDDGLGGELSREHTAAVAEVELPWSDAYHGRAKVAVVAVENAYHPDGPVNRSAPVVYVQMSGGALSGSDARRIAAALLDAADVWDTAPQGEDDPLVTGR